MPISFSCPNCQKKLKAPEQAAGKTLPCPQCKTRVTVPSPEKTAEEFDPSWLEENEPASTEPEDRTPAIRTNYSEEEQDSPPVPTKPVEKVTKPKVVPLKADETPGWMRHLHLILLLALIPLIISLGITTKREESLANLLDSISDLEPQSRIRLLEALEKGDEDALFRALPDNKLKGAWLARDTKAHWGLAFGSALLFFIFLFALSLRGTANIGHLLLVCGFTATAGIFLLLSVQAIAEWTQGRIIVGRGIFTIVFYIFKFIGFSYRAALDSDNGFVLSFLGFVFGIGLCEELVKAIPVLFYLRRPDANWHGALLWGLASGIGFGVAEGIVYSRDFYNGIYGPDIYAVRFLSCVALHASFSGGVAILLMMMRDKLVEAETWAHMAGTTFLAILPPMIFHGLYDTFLKRDLNTGALITAVVSFGYLAVLSYFLHGKDDVEANAEMLRQYKKMRKAT